MPGRVLRIRLRPEPHLLGLARIAGSFTRHRVPYCAIGGFAAAMYLPHRHPDDIDLIIGPSPRAGMRAAVAIASLSFDPGAGVSASDTFTDPRQLADGQQVIIATAYGTLHVIGTHLPDGCDRSAIIQRRSWFVVGRYPVAVCRLDDLLEIKQAANHGKDAADVAELLSVYRPRT
jgi:hypothetical protein